MEDRSQPEDELRSVNWQDIACRLYIEGAVMLGGKIYWRGCVLTKCQGALTSYEHRSRAEQPRQEKAMLVSP